MTSAAASDVRDGGEWTRAQSLKNDAILFLVRAALALLVPLSPRVLNAVGRAIGRFALVALRGTRRSALRGAALAFPEMEPGERRALVQRSYVALGGHLGDALASLDPRRPLVPLAVDEATIAVLARARLDAQGKPRGVVFPSAHLGPWERVAATLVARGVPMTVLARASYDPRLARVYDRLRGARGVDAISRGDAGAPTRIVRALRSGRVLAVPMDLRSRVQSVDWSPFSAGTPRCRWVQRASRSAWGPPSSWGPSRSTGRRRARSALHARRSRRTIWAPGKLANASSRRESRGSCRPGSGRSPGSGSGCTIASAGRIQ